MLKARAYKSGWDPSAIVSAGFMIGQTQTWTLATDFSDITNPTYTGMWAYGVVGQIASPSLNPLLEMHTFNWVGGGDFPGGTQPGWIHSAVVPGVCRSIGVSAHDFPTGRFGGTRRMQCNGPRRLT